MYYFLCGLEYIYVIELARGPYWEDIGRVGPHLPKKEQDQYFPNTERTSWFN